ncbi:site-2 protease family protein [Kineococcus gynurae]|uniref:Zinc metalloprotease n=1 Tax=Kineococcus gynurae TaxID=452979 RepID=A0ABV5LQU7_9ACTN
MVPTSTRDTAPARRPGIPLGRPFGVPLFLAPSWFLFAGVIVLIFGPIVETRIPGPTTDPATAATAYAVAFGYAVLLLVSVLLHEIAHAVAARAVGMRVAGIVLNVWGGHTSFREDVSSPGRSLLIAVVGPITNGLIALLAYRVAAGASAGPNDPGTLGIGGLLLGALALSNLLLCIFNLLPGLPLDGGHALEALVWKIRGDRLAGTVAAAWTGRVLAVAVLALAILLPWLRGGQPSFTSVIWAGLVGALLWQGASASLAWAGQARRVPHLSARTLQRPAIAVASGASVEEVVRSARAAIDAGATRGGDGDLEVVLVTDAGVPVAVVDTAALRRIPAERRGEVGIGAAARALPPRAWVPEDLAGEELLATLTARPGEHVVIGGGGRVVGLLHTGDVVAAVTRR